MTTTLIAQVCTSAGLTEEIDGAGDPIPYRTPANSYLRHQPAVIPVYVNHDTTWKLGEVVHLERNRRDGLLAVARLDTDAEGMLDDHEWHISDGIACRRSGPLGMDKYGIKLRELSLVGQTANVNTRRAFFSRGDIATRTAGAPHGLPLFWHDTWQRAAERSSRARYGLRPEHLDIVDFDELDLIDELLTDPAYARRLLAEHPTAKATATTRSSATRTELDGDRVYRHSYPTASLAVVDPN